MCMITYMNKSQLKECMYDLFPEFYLIHDHMHNNNTLLNEHHIGTCCKEEITVGSKTFTWKEVSRNTTICHPCPNNIKYSVSRLCNSQGKWEDFDRDGCGVLDDQLDNLVSSITNVKLMIVHECIRYNNYSQPHLLTPIQIIN